jgi:hypothetical protein
MTAVRARANLKEFVAADAEAKGLRLKGYQKGDW